MTTIEKLIALSPLPELLRRCKMSDDEIIKHLTKLNEQIEIGALWSLAQSRGDTLAHLADLSQEEKNNYITSFSNEEYLEAITLSSEVYITDFVTTIEKSINNYEDKY